MISSDAKCKVSAGEPGTPIASVSRGKRVIVGVNQTLQVSDHDYSKISLIPDATCIQTIPHVDDFLIFYLSIFSSRKQIYCSLAKKFSQSRGSPRKNYNKIH